MRFHVLYDEKTKLLLAAFVSNHGLHVPARNFSRTNAMISPLANGTASSSISPRTWSTGASPEWVAIGATAKQSRHYASMDIDGDDLVILSRSADESAKSAHETNLITFHRVKNFRDLVY